MVSALPKTGGDYEWGHPAAQRNHRRSGRQRLGDRSPREKRGMDSRAGDRFCRRGALHLVCRELGRTVLFETLLTNSNYFQLFFFCLRYNFTKLWSENNYFFVSNVSRPPLEGEPALGGPSGPPNPPAFPGGFAPQTPRLPWLGN